MNETTLPHLATPGPAGKVSPDDLLGGFSQGNLLRWFLAALAIHVVVISGFSVGTIRDWVDPEGAKARQEALVAAARAAATPGEAPATRGEAAPAEAAAGAAAPSELQTAEGQTPIEKATTAAAKPDEIPDVPDDLGLSIDDTNPK